MPFKNVPRRKEGSLRPGPLRNPEQSLSGGVAGESVMSVHQVVRNARSAISIQIVVGLQQSLKKPPDVIMKYAKAIAFFGHDGP